MRSDEQFVGRALVEFLGGPACASATDGENPPDLYLTIDTARVGVEVTRLSQFTIERDGTLGNRATQDFFGIQLLNELNNTIGPLLPHNVALSIGLWVPVPKAARFKKLLTELVTKVATSPEKGMEREFNIADSKVCISVIPERPSGKKIAGFVVNTNSSSDIGLNARLVLEDRIRTKNTICASLPKPIWLAVLNDYWLADADTYYVACREIKFAHCFDRIFLISDKATVNELSVGA